MKEFNEFAKSLTKAVENEYTRLHDKKISLETAARHKGSDLHN